MTGRPTLWMVVGVVGELGSDGHVYGIARFGDATSL